MLLRWVLPSCIRQKRCASDVCEMARVVESINVKPGESAKHINGDGGASGPAKAWTWYKFSEVASRAITFLRAGSRAP